MCWLFRENWPISFSCSSRTSIGTALLCFQSIRLYSITVIHVSTKYKRLPCDYQFSWLGSKSAVQCCVETPQAGNPPSGFAPWTVSCTITAYKVSLLCLSFCPTPTTCVRKGIAAHVFLDSHENTPTHYPNNIWSSANLNNRGGKRGAKAETSRSHQRHKWLHLMDCAMHYNIIDLMPNNLQFNFIYRMKQLEIQSDSAMCSLHWGAETSSLLNGVYVESQWKNIEFFLFAAFYVSLCWNKILVHSKITAEQ